MGHIDYSFLIKRTAMRYAEIYVKEGALAANKYYTECPYTPSSHIEKQQFEAMINYNIQNLKKTPSPPTAG